MGKEYQFQCKDCKLELMLRKGVGKISTSPSQNFYCTICEKISHQKKCLWCEEELLFKFVIPQKNVSLFTSKRKNMKQNTSICPRCKSQKTEIKFTSEWD